MRNIHILAIAVAITACTSNQNRTEVQNTGASGTAPVAVDANSAVGAFALRMIADGRETFRHDTFGDEDFWSNTLQLDRALLANGAASSHRFGRADRARRAVAGGFSTDRRALSG